ncbi:ATP-binding protein [Pseudanabaena sp. FACHB-1277]|uniref:ATP-binding protein n=1 Tax=Pseudanabaena cinerea FACHB-1277 TaxID=2949581 RepID=A0A926UR55_9CYAN|nr:ATP-binding protein [Pseudanabaena cinerea]MBD2149318.1 ATP-binding protein [Pseudanabaena cinerea FACHB-1277]
MNLNEFILKIAKSKLLNPKYIPTLIAVFGEEGRGKSIEKCCEEFLKDSNGNVQPRQTTDSYLKQIYEFFWQKHPELSPVDGNRKRKVLTDYLVELYEKQENKDGNSDRPSTPTNPQNIPNPESIPELTTLEFIGRDRDLTNLANLSRQAKIVLIKAGAGVGKSTLAREFLQTYFKKVIRLEMGLESGNVTPAEEKVSQILRKDFDEEPSRDFGINLDILREKLADRANPIGVLIDNLEPALDENYRFREKLRGYDALLAVLGDRDVSSFTLITSRRSLITPRARVHEYSLEGLDITAWQQYFHDCENGADSEALLQMCVAYNGNAKVMDILHGAIKNRFDGNIGAYWSRYKDALLADSELETLISVEMDWLRDNQPNAYKLLCRMGCYRYQDVKTVPFDGLICLLWDVAESQRIGVVNYLSKTSLIEAKGEYYLHPAVREFTKLRLLEDKINWEIVNLKAAEYWESTIVDKTFLQNHLNVFEAFYHYYTIENYKNAFLIFIEKTNITGYERNRYAYLRFWGYSSQIANCLKKLIDKLEGIDKTQLLGTIGACYYYNTDYKLAIEFFEKAKCYVESESDYCHQRLHSDCHNYLARCYRHLGEFNKAIQHCNIALNNIDKINLLEEEKIKKEKHYLERMKSSIFRSFSSIYHDLCEYDKGISYAEQSLKCSNHSSKLEVLYRESGDSLAYKSLSLYAQNNSSEAIDTMLHAIENFEVVKDYLSEGYARCYLIRFYLKTDLREAQTQILRVQEICNRGCKPIMFQARFCGSKALFYRQNFYLTQERKYLNDTISQHLECIKLLDRIQVKSQLAEEYFQLALTYQAIGEHNQAEEYKAKALELFAQMEAPKQIERVNKAFRGNIQ